MMAKLLLVLGATAVSGFQSGLDMFTKARTPGRLSMKATDLIGAPGIKGIREFPIWDPLGLAKDEKSLFRRRAVELKHGRIAMVAVIGMMAGELFPTFPGYISPTAGLKFSDIPPGAAALAVVPKGGLFQIIAACGLIELTVGKQDYENRAPGELGNPVFGEGFKPADPKEFERKQLVELKNGRLAMLAIMGELVQEQTTGLHTYQQLSLGKVSPFEAGFPMSM